MTTAPNTDYRYCAALGRAVCTRRTEGHCRDENDCYVVDCPLSRAFGDLPQACRSRNLMAATGVAWVREAIGI